MARVCSVTTGSISLSKATLDIVVIAPLGGIEIIRIWADEVLPSPAPTQIYASIYVGPGPAAFSGTFVTPVIVSGDSPRSTAWVNDDFTVRPVPTFIIGCETEYHGLDMVINDFRIVVPGGQLFGIGLSDQSNNHVVGVVYRELI